MKRNLVLIVLTLVLAIGAAVLYYTNKGSGTIGEAAKAFAIEDTSKVTKIFLADKYGSQTTLERGENDVWTMNGGQYNAREDAVKTLLTTMKNLAVQSPVGKNARKTILKDMASRAVKVEIYMDGKNKPSKVYYVGGATQNNQGTYMKMEGAEEPFVMEIPGFVGYLSTRYFTESYKWRSTVLFSKPIDQIKSVKVEYTAHPDQSFEIELHDGKEVTLKALQPETYIESFDTVAIAQYLGNFKRINYEAVENYSASKVDSILATPVVFAITMVDVDGNTTTVKSYRKKSRYTPGHEPENPSEYDVDRMYANINDEKEIVLIQFFVFDKLLKELDFFETDPVQRKETGEKNS